ncbi:hypothetical protein [Streptacidiphilus sp. PAMC 29251]
MSSGEGAPIAIDTSSLSERGWEALAELRRLENRGLIAARQPGGIHLATIKALMKLGLADIEDHPERDRKGRKWVARLTEAGRRLIDSPE